MSFLDRLFEQDPPPELVIAEATLEGDSTIFAGYLYRVSAGASDIALTLAAQSLTNIQGKRVAVKIATQTDEVGGGVLTVSAPDGYQIEGDGGELADSASFIASLGAYREWICDDSRSWRLVIEPAQAPTGEADALMFATGEPIPLGTRPTVGQVLKFDGDELNGADESGGGGASSEFYAPPTNPASKSEDFTSETLDARWQVRMWSTWATVIVDGPVDESNAPASGHARITPNYRGSWCAIQQSAGELVTLRRLESSRPSIVQYRFRLSQPPTMWGTSANGGNAVYFTRDVAGVPDLTNYLLRVGWIRQNATTLVPQLFAINAGAPGAIDGPDMLGVDGEFIVLFAPSVGTRVLFRPAAGGDIELALGSAITPADAGNPMWIIWRGNQPTSYHDPRFAHQCDYVHEIHDENIYTP